MSALGGVAASATAGSGLRVSQNDGWIETQTKTFTNWVNVQLEKGGHTAIPESNVVEAFKIGVPLLQTVCLIKGIPKTNQVLFSNKDAKACVHLNNHSLPPYVLYSNVTNPPHLLFNWFTWGHMHHSCAISPNSSKLSPANQLSITRALDFACISLRT